MTREEIISMAREAGCIENVGNFYAHHKNLERFAKLVTEKEREACAKEIEDQWTWDMNDPAATACRIIRARGQQ